MAEFKPCPFCGEEPKVEITNCTNEGDIERTVDDTAAAKNNNICIGGIAAYLAGGAGYSIVDSSNNGKVSTNTNQGSAVVRIAGIAGYLVANTTVKNCNNSGAIEYKMGDETECKGSYLCLGGIVGHMYKNSKIESCANKYKYLQTYPDSKKGAIANAAGQLYRFCHEVLPRILVQVKSQDSDIKETTNHLARSIGS